MVKKTDKAAVASSSVQLPDSAKDWSYLADGDKSLDEAPLTGETGNTEQYEQISPEVSDFYVRYHLALKNWVKEHGTAKPPVYVDPIDGKLKWANREMRKRHMKARMKAKSK